MNSSAVETHGLRVVRGRREVLHGLDLTIEQGAITGLIGPSGCGKTTLMRSIVGVQLVAGGTVTVLGQPAGSAPLRRQVGYSTQSPAVYADLTVIDNLRYFASVLAGTVEDAARALAEVSLQSHRSQLVGALSGGERSRVSLAVALLAHPPLLILDEPTVGLDPVLREELWRLFHALVDSQGATLVVSSHVMDEASRCDTLILMRDGAVLAHDTPGELRRATGTADLEQAFLQLVRQNQHAVPA
jgi:ABC-2 type transport system ATP-binding protein